LTNDVGKMAVMGGSVLGLGGLCLWGVLSRPEDAAIDQSMAWPAYVRERIQATYLNFGYGLAVTAGTVYTLSKRPKAIGPVFGALCTMPGWIASMAIVFGAGIGVQMMPYKGNFGAKQVAWTGYSALIGVMVLPTIVIFGPLVPRALILTGGVLSGLTAVAVTAPSDKFLYMGGTLGMGFGALFVANIGSMFLGPAKFPIVNNIVMYGGVLLFSGFILHYTQGLIHKAKAIPREADAGTGSQVATRNYDPINSAIGLYVHTLNLFMTILRVLAANGGRKK
jgi:FtsH-binding integral membrane protein